jgi:hypothetical protein
VYDGEEGEDGREEEEPRAGDGGVAEETEDMTVESIKVESGDISAVMSGPPRATPRRC